MTTKKKESMSEKKSRVKVGKLKLNKESVKELTDSEGKAVQGGAELLGTLIFCPTDNCATVGDGTCARNGCRVKTVG